MRDWRERGLPQWLLPAVLVLLTGGVAAAENIDPGGDDSQYAWGENVGWLNAEPSGDGGPGVSILTTMGPLLLKSIPPWVPASRDGFSVPDLIPPCPVFV